VRSEAGRNDLEPARPGFIDVEVFRKPDALIRYFHVQIRTTLFPRNMDFPFPVRVGVLGSVGDKLIDEQAEGNCFVCRNHQRAEFAPYRVSERSFLELVAKLASEVGDVN
jgi:hypothetical protein